MELPMDEKQQSYQTPLLDEDGSVVCYHVPIIHGADHPLYYPLPCNIWQG